MKMLHRMAALGTIAGGLLIGSPSAHAGSATLTMSFTEEVAATTFRAELRDASGPRFLVSMSNDSIGSSFVVVGQGKLDLDGDGTAVFVGPDTASMGPQFLYFRATYLSPTGRTSTDWMPLGINEPCQRLNFNYDTGANQLPAGTKISEQWADAGIHISTQNGNASGPDQAIIFDSSNPTGDDPDLVTPGYGPGNTVPLGNLLIIAEDVVDLNNDGLVDDPDDAAAGGIITFDFDRPVAMCSIALIDLDEGAFGSVIRFFNGATQIGEIDLPPAGDNSSQIVNFHLEDVTKVTVNFTGSGGIPFMGILPCPFRVNFDFNTFGEPATEYVAGEILDEELDGLGVFPSGENNTAGHPDLLTIFDTANPTGEDPDLQTPGFGPGNTVAQDNVAIIAEDAVDANADGLIDDPDDEAFGGVMHFDFTYDFIFESATVLDVDGNESSFIALYDVNDNLLGQIQLANLGDNSSQTVTASVDGVRRFELHLGGSGALASFEGCPEF